MADRDVAAAAGRVVWRVGLEPEFVGQVETESGQRAGLVGDGTDARFHGDTDAFAGGGEAEHGWCAVEHPADSGPRIERSIHRELVRLAEPTPDRLGHPILDLARDEDERRSARPAVEELVRAADGQLHSGGREVEFEHARRVRQVPDRRGSVCGGACGLTGDVGDLGGSVVDQ